MIVQRIRCNVWGAMQFVLILVMQKDDNIGMAQNNYCFVKSADLFYCRMWTSVVCIRI